MMFRKGLAVAVILLFIGMCVVPSTAVQEFKDVSTVSFDGNTLYVGGLGPNNYTHIQDAVDDAVDGDTIFVYNGTYTFKKSGNRGMIDIREKSISLIGEDKNTTILDGNFTNGHGVVHVDAEVFSISGFTIKNSWGITGPWFGIEIGFNDNEETYVYDNIIYGHEDGIIVWGGICYIYDNQIFNNERGIYLNPGSSSIKRNIISNNDVGLYSIGLDNNISCNIIENNVIGIEIESRSSVYNNHIEGNEFGLVTIESIITVTKNNFIDNDIQAEYTNLLNFPIAGHNKWDNNYWSNWKLPIPKLVHGYWGYYFIILALVLGLDLYFGPFIGFQFDWNPALEPHDIEVL